MYSYNYLSEEEKIKREKESKRKKDEENGFKYYNCLDCGKETFTYTPNKDAKYYPSETICISCSIDNNKMENK